MLMKTMAILLSLTILTLSAAAEEASTLTVVGEGEVAVPADTVYVTVSVTIQDDNVTLASLENEASLDRTVEALVDVGVKREDVPSGRGISVQSITTRSRVCNNSTCVIVTENSSRVTGQVTIRFDAEDGKRLEIFEPSCPAVGQQPAGFDPLDLSMMDIFDLWAAMMVPLEAETSPEPGMLEVRSQVVVTYEVSS
jgi:uncharacterized protein YggE